MGSARRPGNTAGRHLEQHHPLPKGQACSTCKARKVRCSAGTPACQACMRTARFEGRDPSLVLCQYNGLKCGVKGGKSKTSNPLPEAEATEQDPMQLENEMAQLEKIVRANLKALPNRTSSSSSSSSSSASSIASTSTSEPRLPSASTSNFVPSTWPPVDASNFSYFPDQLPYLFPLTSPLPWSASHFPMPASPDSFHSASSFDTDYVYTPTSPLFESTTPPEHFLTSEHTDDTLSLPLFPLPPVSQTYGSYAPQTFVPVDYGTEEWREDYWMENPFLWNQAV